MRKIKLPGGKELPILGLGTWFMGESPSQFKNEVKAVRYAMDCGIELIDTAEMYANGRAEEVIGAAIKDVGENQRENMFIVSKVLPSNAHFDGVIHACNHSMRRLNVTFIDMYLLHWRGSTPLQETLDAFMTLQSSGKIRHFGVSNFNSSDLNDWHNCKEGGALATNQILYNLNHRGVEWDVIPLCKDHSIPVMAYSPLDQGRLESSPVLAMLAERHRATPLQVALAWVLAQENVIAIPKAVIHHHIKQNIKALDINLDENDHAILNSAFPAPNGPSSLEIL